MNRKAGLGSCCLLFLFQAGFIDASADRAPFPQASELEKAGKALERDLMVYRVSKDRDAAEQLLKKTEEYKAGSPERYLTLRAALVLAKDEKRNDVVTAKKAMVEIGRQFPIDHVLQGDKTLRNLLKQKNDEVWELCIAAHIELASETVDPARVTEILKAGEVCAQLRQERAGLNAMSHAYMSQACQRIRVDDYELSSVFADKARRIATDAKLKGIVNALKKDIDEINKATKETTGENRRLREKRISELTSDEKESLALFYCTVKEDWVKAQELLPDVGRRDFLDLLSEDLRLSQEEPTSRTARAMIQHGIRLCARAQAEKDSGRKRVALFKRGYCWLGRAKPYLGIGEGEQTKLADEKLKEAARELKSAGFDDCDLSILTASMVINCDSFVLHPDGGNLLHDLSGWGNHGIPRKPCLTLGPAGCALHFNGVGDFMEGSVKPRNLPIGSFPRTVMVWIRISPKFKCNGPCSNVLSFGGGGGMKESTR